MNGVFVSLVDVYNPSLLEIRYFGFGGYVSNHLEFFYNCPTPVVCTSYYTNRYIYDTFFRVSRRGAYIADMRFYVDGDRDANIFFSREKNFDYGYEIGTNTQKKLSLKQTYLINLIRQYCVLDRN